MWLTQEAVRFSDIINMSLILVSLCSNLTTNILNSRSTYLQSCPTNYPQSIRIPQNGVALIKLWISEGTFRTIDNFYSKNKKASILCGNASTAYQKYFEAFSSQHFRFCFLLFYSSQIVNLFWQNFHEIKSRDVEWKPKKFEKIKTNWVRGIQWLAHAECKWKTEFYLLSSKIFYEENSVSNLYKCRQAGRHADRQAGICR